MALEPRNKDMKPIYVADMKNCEGCKYLSHMGPEYNKVCSFYEQTYERRTVNKDGTRRVSYGYCDRYKQQRTDQKGIEWGYRARND